MSPAFVTIGRTKGQSETRGVVDTLIDATGLVFEDFTTPDGMTKNQLQQHVIVMRGRFATQEFLALDLDIMLRLNINMKRVS